MSLTQSNAIAARPNLQTDENSHAPIVVHCHLRWDFVWQRPQQILSRLARHHRILFLEDPMNGIGSQRLEITAPQANIVRVVPVLPGFATAMSIDEQCQATLDLLARAFVDHPLLKGHFENPIQWFYSPMSAKVFLHKLDAATVVYDCMDELANFKFAPSDLAEREEELLARADIVFTGGHQLFKAKSQKHNNTHFFGCGVDVAHFGRARLAATEIPPDIADLPRPIIGYFGVIDERLDYELIAEVAQRFPEGSVVMVGPLAKVRSDDLPEHSNIHWLGQRPYLDLPNIVKAFDVCMMPFALNAATQYINPTKTLEYMAAGKPVVSTAIQDVVRNFTPVVTVAYSHREFGDAVQQALLEPQLDLLALGLERAAAATWDVTVTHMRALMLRSAKSSISKYSLSSHSAEIIQLLKNNHRARQPAGSAAMQSAGDHA